MLLFAATACPQQSEPYVRYHANGQPTAPCLSWLTRDLTYEISDAGSARTPGDTERDAVTASFATWQAVADDCSDFHFRDGHGASSKNLVVWRERTCEAAAPALDPCFQDGTCSDTYDCWDDDAQSLALTRLTYSTSTGAILDATIQLNAAHWLFTTVDSPPCREGAEATTCVASDVQNTVTHEIGHLLGLDHVPGASSTMSATAPLAETSKRAIDPGTRDGFCHIYPRANPTPSCL